MYLSKFSVRLFSLELVFGIRGIKEILSSAGVLIAGGWESPVNIKALLIARKLRIPSILFYESTLSSHRFTGFFANKFRSWVFSLADLVVTAGTASTEAVLQIGVPPEKIVTLFNPVDVQLFFNVAVKNRVTISNGHRFLFVGQLIERKNLNSLIDAFCSIRQPGDILTIVGDGPLRARLVAYAKSLGLDGIIQFTGSYDQEQVALEYSKHDTFILPSTNEVWGLVVNEALAAGLHVVVSNKAGVADFIQSMDGAFVVDPTPMEIARALKLSRDSWDGPIVKPEILHYTPERFASLLLDSLLLLKKSASI